MVNNYYKIYVDSIITLVNTMTIKFDQAARAMNDKIMQDYGYSAVDQEDKYSWKYYQNISGVYHFSNSDIKIISLDTLEEIPFTITALADHPATRRAYYFGSYYYNKLVEKYPNDELLIKGVLYPADLFVAVDAADGTILSYNTGLVEKNETSLIDEVQTWIYEYIARWVNQQYTVAHDLYTPMYMAQIYLFLVPLIINIRLQKCKTQEAHSFHIRNYLASNLELDEFYQFLTDKQALFLYRNIDYIKSNHGKQEVFDWLVQNIMTARGLPLYGYDARHDTALMTLDSGATNRPEILFRRIPINYPAIDPKKNIYTTQEILDKISVAASGNAQYHKHNYDEIYQSLIDSRYNNVYTKLLESSITDYSQAVPHPLEETLLNEWFAMSLTNRYNVYAQIELPHNKEIVTLSAKDAFVVFVYSLLKSWGVNTSGEINITASRYYKANTPSISQLKTLFGGSLLNDSDYIGALQYAPINAPIRSIDAFYNRASQIYELNLRHYYSESKCEHFIKTGELKVMHSQLFESRLFAIHELTPDYESVLLDNDIDIANYSKSEHTKLCTEIFENITGARNNKKIGVKALQRAMVNLLRRLLSYSVAIIDNAQTSPIMLVSDPGVKIGDIGVVDVDNIFDEVNDVTVLDVRAVDRHNIPSDDTSTVYENITEVTASSRLSDIQSDSEYLLSCGSCNTIYLEANYIDITGISFDEDYASLTASEKAFMSSMWLPNTVS